jgi:hypothetical protein
MSSVSTEIAPREIPFEWLWRWFAGGFRAVENGSVRLARRKGLAIASVAAATIVLRLALLPVLPIPVPEVHDEFSYLLAADTFAHGRLTNPPHAMAQYLETFHVNQHPTYMSKYPPGQGAVLAVGELLGNPWIGVLLSVAALCAAVTWMLQGWVPPGWALLGGVFVLLRFGLFGYWINSYWGGAAAAIGGALVAGALPRILHSHRTRDALMLGLGTAILANSRPFEGLIFSAPVFGFLAVWLFSRRSPSWRKTLPRIIAPLLAAGALCALFMGYYNWRGTGHVLLFPYSLNDRTYMSTPAFTWQAIRTPLRYANPQFDAFYNGFARQTWEQGHVTGVASFFSLLGRDSLIFLNYFLWPELCLPLLALPLLFRDRKSRFLLFQIAICLLAFPLVVWFQPHYAAPMTAAVIALVIQSMRHLRRWTIREFPIGFGLTRALVIAAIALVPFHMDWSTPLPTRTALEHKLDAMPGQHLVIVRYSSQHSPLYDWVYNGADIDDSKIVWAREIPGVSDKPLIDYFHGRQVWLVQPDRPAPPPAR